MVARSRILAFVAFLLALSATLLAQDKLSLTAAFEPAKAKPGEEVVLVLRAEVDERYHAYGTLEKTNIPVALNAKKLDAGGLEPKGAAQIPPGTKTSAFGVDTYPLPHEFDVKQRFVVPAGTAAGDVVVRGVLAYQLCDENSCLPPSSAAFEATLTVIGAPGDAGLGVKPGLRLEPDQKIAVRASVVPATARAGENVRLVVDVQVSKAYHAYGSKEKTGVPTRIDATKLKAPGLEAVGEPRSPAGERTEHFGLEEFWLRDHFQLEQVLKVAAGTKPGTVAIEGAVHYQLCTDNFCEKAADLAFSTQLVVEAGAARAEAVAAVADEIPPESDNLLAGSLFALILACIGGGLFALVMPCTYPMIPITFSFFTKQADARGGKVLTLALGYGAGIVGMFALIGALAGLLAGYIVPFAAHWITNVVIGGAFVVFALSLLGVITLQPPAFLVQAAGKTRGVGGTLGVLLMGATLVVTSFTCTAPVVSLLLLPAVQSGAGWKATLGMAVFGLTMAFPFVMLALLPGRVKALPKSGAWMNTLKVTLGFVELAAALKFFSNAEYVVELHILPREVFFGIWIAIFAALAAYLIGIVPRATTGTPRKVGGLASLAFAGYCLYGALGYPLDFVMTALAPAYGRKDVSKHELVVDDYEKALAQAKAEGKLLLVNFTGFTCTNCRMVERGILPSDAIAPILSKHFVEARLHMDNEAVIPPGRWAVHSKLREDLIGGRLATPTYVTLDPATGKKLVEHVLRGGPGAWKEGYATFLAKTLEATGRVAAGNGAAGN
ncbi:MAG: thioredoxin family protein [Planctomycetes bacterium]|nr:thioredoxin family protein [Planctomycetota bacterium]